METETEDGDQVNEDGSINHSFLILSRNDSSMVWFILIRYDVL